LAYKIKTSGNYPEESIQHPEHGESLKSRIIVYLSEAFYVNRFLDLRCVVILRWIHFVTPLKMEPTQVTETSEVKTQTPGKFPEESTLAFYVARGRA
jgi:hypothetical protein